MFLRLQKSRQNIFRQAKYENLATEEMLARIVANLIFGLTEKNICMMPPTVRVPKIEWIDTVVVCG